MKPHQHPIYGLLIVLFLLPTSCGTVDIQVENSGTQSQLLPEASATLPVQTEQAPVETAASIPLVSETTGEVAQPSEQSTAAPAQTVAGWLGHVVSLPAGSQYDDFLILSPAGTGEFGLAGATPELEGQIEALRDKSEPGKYAHFWGTLTCDVPDYNGCQLLVDRIRAGASATDPEPVDGWEGTITSAVFNSGRSKVFVLSGKYPMQFSIDSLDESIRAELESLCDTQALVKVWGELLTGIPDVNGSRLHITRLEVIKESQDPAPTVETSGLDPTAGWPVFSNAFYKYEFRYPESATISMIGPQSFASEDLPEGMTPPQYMDQLTKTYTTKLCVMVEYSLGYVAISAPPNLGNKYAICGRTGASAGEMINKIENVEVNGWVYPANGFEIISGGETLDLHNETFRVNLPDGTVIEYGALPDSTATYEDYQMKTKEVLRQILASYTVIE